MQVALRQGISARGNPDSFDGALPIIVQVNYYFIACARLFVSFRRRCSGRADQRDLTIRSPDESVMQQIDRSSSLTLFESLVALGLLALAATGFFGAYRVGIDAGTYAQQLAVVTAWSQARLETIRSDPLQIVEVSGAPVPLSGLPKVTERIEVRAESSDVNQLTITLFWDWRGRPHQTVLTTLVRQPSGK